MKWDPYLKPLWQWVNMCIKSWDCQTFSKENIAYTASKLHKLCIAELFCTLDLFRHKILWKPQSLYKYWRIKCSFITSRLNMAKGAKEIWIHFSMYSSQNHLLCYQKCFNLLCIVFLSAMSLPLTESLTLNEFRFPARARKTSLFFENRWGYMNAFHDLYCKIDFNLYFAQLHLWHESHNLIQLFHLISV